MKIENIFLHANEMKCFVMAIRAAVNFYYQFLRNPGCKIVELKREIFLSLCPCNVIARRISKLETEAADHKHLIPKANLHLSTDVHQETLENGNKNILMKPHMARSLSNGACDCLRLSVAAADASVINEFFPSLVVC